jgi:DNA-binding transcriptional ArsR family regulator
MTGAETGADRLARVATRDPVVAAVRRHAFIALLDHRPMTATELADVASLAPAEVDRALARLRAGGALETDSEGRVIGAHGLTRRRTRHRIVTSQRTRNTWCALDAIGIPVALRFDATVHTECPTCTSEITLHVRDGEVLTQTDAPTLWLPGGACGHVMDDFCAAANLFCTTKHLELWRHDAGRPPGQPMRLEDAARHGRHVWADVADCW